MFIILFCTLSFYFKAYGAEVSGDRALSNPKARIFLEKSPESARDFSIQDDNTGEKVGIIAASLCPDQTIQINRFEIEEPYRRKGYGFQGLELFIRDIGLTMETCKMIRLIVWKDNPAIRLYKKVGFKECDGKDLIEGYLWMSKDIFKREVL